MQSFVHKRHGLLSLLNFVFKLRNFSGECGPVSHTGWRNCWLCSSLRESRGISFLLGFHVESHVYSSRVHVTFLNHRLHFNEHHLKFIISFILGLWNLFLHLLNSLFSCQKLFIYFIVRGKPILFIKANQWLYSFLFLWQMKKLVLFFFQIPLGLDGKSG